MGERKGEEKEGSESSLPMPLVGGRRKIKGDGGDGDGCGNVKSGRWM